MVYLRLRHLWHCNDNNNERRRCVINEPERHLQCIIGTIPWLPISALNEMFLIIWWTNQFVVSAKPAVKYDVIPSIIRGEDASEGEFPWQLSMERFGSHSCGAVLVSNGGTTNRAITAAHCIQGSEWVTMATDSCIYIYTQFKSWFSKSGKSFDIIQIQRSEIF